ncbi:MAG TPA: tRNA (N6-isopentenyl adenosine(37)-C2)-methylthiotransferase MiaB [Terriglobia bacterium]|nr:tRNA (N6-isopentenyl adenosine(37)-C2)-methylthiotransferase MiaB [Terriglobia bacterium]
MKYYVRTYGCQMNVADSNEMGRHLQARGIIQTEDADDATLLLVNTCTVRQHAEDRAFSEIGRLKKWKARKPGRKVVVTGCAAERTKEYLEGRFPHIDLVVGAKSIEDFSSLVEGLLERRPEADDLDYATPTTSDQVSAFVTVMRGCNYSCTYCIVPYVRGRESYHPIEQVLGEVRDRVREGVKEITLLGQTVNSYHRDGNRGKGTDFADLLEAVGAVEGVERVRFISPHPYYMTDRVIQAMAEVPEVCEGLHLPVQSGSTSMLKKMQRNYSREGYLELIRKLRVAMPDMTISTDVIVGFPGESDADFRETLSLIEDVGFDFGFVFKYSARAGTPAAALDGFPEELIEERHRECLALVEGIAAKKRERWIGTVQDVLIEEEGFGRTRGNAKVAVQGNARVGETVRVRIAGTEKTTFEGAVV